MIHLFEQHYDKVEQGIFGKYMHGMIRQLPYHGAVTHTIGFLGYPHTVRLFNNAQIRKERAFTYSQLAQIANPAEKSHDFHSHVENLVHYGILYRGYRLQCEHCGLDRWYPLQDVDNLRCKGCRQSIFIPLEQQLAYQLNPLWAEGLKNGALTTFLALFHFQRRYPQIDWDAGLILQKAGGEAEIDLAIRADKTLYLIECKDKPNTKYNHLIGQLNRIQHIADEIDAKVILATISTDELPDELAIYLQEKQIELLSGSDLMTNH